jgi:hypothetical protein
MKQFFIPPARTEADIDMSMRIYSAGSIVEKGAVVRSFSQLSP